MSAAWSIEIERTHAIVRLRSRTLVLEREATCVWTFEHSFTSNRFHAKRRAFDLDASAQSADPTEAVVRWLELRDILLRHRWFYSDGWSLSMSGSSLILPATDVCWASGQPMSDSERRSLQIFVASECCDQISLTDGEATKPPSLDWRDSLEDAVGSASLDPRPLAVISESCTAEEISKLEICYAMSRPGIASRNSFKFIRIAGRAIDPKGSCLTKESLTFRTAEGVLLECVRMDSSEEDIVNAIRRNLVRM